MSIKRINRTYEVDIDIVTMSLFPGDGGKAFHIVELDGKEIAAGKIIEDLKIGKGPDLRDRQRVLEVITTFASLGNVTDKTSIIYEFAGGTTRKRWRASQKVGDNPVVLYFAQIDFD